MSPVKRFLISFVVIYAIGAIAGILLWGPPGISTEYVSENRIDHERFKEITSSDWFKHHGQSEEANPLTERQEKSITFLEEYESRPAYLAEEHRAHFFEMYFEFYNAIAFLILAGGLGWKPAVGMIDNAVNDHRERLDSALASKKEASSKQQAAKEQVASVPMEQKHIQKRAETQGERERSEIEKATEAVLAQLQSELASRKTLEQQRAAMDMRQEIVDKAIVLAEQQLRDSMTADREHALIGQFANDLEGAL